MPKACRTYHLNASTATFLFIPTESVEDKDRHKTEKIAAFLELVFIARDSEMTIVTFRTLEEGGELGSNNPAILQFSVREPLIGVRHEALESSFSSTSALTASTEIRETTGLHSWPSSLLLGSHMIDMALRGELHNISITELGAGTGIGGQARPP